MRPLFCFALLTRLCLLILPLAPGLSPLARAEGAGLHLMIAPQTLRSDEVTLLWDKPAAATRETRYQISCDEAQVAFTDKTHFTLRGLSPQARHQVQVDYFHGERVSGGALTFMTPAKETVIYAEDFGAKADGSTLNTKALQAAIDACPKGGVICLSKGVYLSGALFLKSDMTLLISKGSTLQGSSQLSDYEPFIRNRFEGWELDTYASLLNAGHLDAKGPANVRNLSIRGEGTLSGGGRALGKAMTKAKGQRTRSRLLCLMNCENLEIQGLTLTEPASWTLHYLYSNNISCHDLNIVTAVPNGDGIDPDSSSNSYIFHCQFSTGDDCIAVKSGKNPEGNRINRPTENVQVTDCVFTKGHGISIGSEMSGGVRGVLVQDCVAGALLNGLQIKGTKERGGFVEDVVVRDCDLQMVRILTELPYNNDGEAAPQQPWFRRFRFQNIDLSQAPTTAPVMIINGYPAEGHRTSGVVFENVKLPAGAVIQIDQCEDVSFSGVSTADGKAPEFKVTRSENVRR
jgi:polygalacturonase